MSHHHTHCHIIIHTMSHHHTYNAGHLVVSKPTLQHHNYVTSSYILCHIIIRYILCHIIIHTTQGTWWSQSPHCNTGCANSTLWASWSGERRRCWLRATTMTASCCVVAKVFFPFFFIYFFFVWQRRQPRAARSQRVFFFFFFLLLVWQRWQSRAARLRRFILFFIFCCYTAPCYTNLKWKQNRVREAGAESRGGPVAYILLPQYRRLFH